MDKNHIHIDEVVRQRLAGAEEERRPGAWIAMREVLDKAMPVGGAAVSAFNWRRMLSYTGALLVAASASFGGYKLYEGQKANKELAVNTPAVPAKNGAGITAASSAQNGVVAGNTTVSDAADGTANNSTSSAVAGNTGVSGTAGTSRGSSNNGSTGTENNSSAANQSNRNNHNNTSNPSSPSTGELVAMNTEPDNIPVTRNNRTSRTAIGNSGTSTASSGNTNPALAPESGNASAATNAAANSVTEAAAPTRNGNRANNRTRNRRRTLAANRNPATPVLAAGTTGAAVANANKPVKTRRTTKTDTTFIYEQAIRPAINPLTMKKSFKADTFSKRIITTQREIEVPVYDEERIKATNPRHSLNAKGSGAFIPQAAPKVAAQFASENAPAAGPPKEAGKAKGNKISLWDRINMQATIDRTRSAFAQVEYRGGLAGGFNTTFSGTSLFGFHLGVMGIAFISSEWSILGELKYYQRVNRGGAFADDYVNRSPAGNGNVWEDSVNHFFNYSTLQTIELPIMARYVKNNFYGLVGLNMTRTLPVNTEEVTHQHNNPVLQPNAVLNPAARQSADITNADFDPRFGMGYILGFGYQFTPAVGVDLRVAQMLWDNARTAGGQRVSKELYKVPSVQVTVGYRFGRNK